MRTSQIPLNLIRLSAFVTCISLGECLSWAQTDQQEHMQIVPPPVPRYRRVRPAFTVEADKAEKPLPPTPSAPLPTVIDPFKLAPVASPPPSSAEIAKKRARLLEAQRSQAISDLWHERLVNVGKVLGFLVVIGIGAAAVADIVRQVRKARVAASMQADEDDEWDR